MRYFLSLISLLFLANCGETSFGESQRTIHSPDGDLSVRFELSEAGEILYTLNQHTSELVAPSSLGFSESDLGKLSKKLILEAVASSEGIEEYELPWGEVARVNAPFTELQLSLKHAGTKFTFVIVARLFDDGLGLQYRIPAQSNVNKESDTVHILEEHTQFNLTGDPLVNWGPGDWNSYENNLELTRRSQIDATKYDDRTQLIHRVVPRNAIMTPATMRMDNGMHLSLHEAALIDYPEMTLGGYRRRLRNNPSGFA